MGVAEKMGEAAPFMVMVVMEGCTIGLTILVKTALTGGMSPFVFVLYTNAVGSLLLLPVSFLFHNHRNEEYFFTSSLLVRIFFMGLTGIATAQNLAFLGLSFSSPIVVCAMGLLGPAISFLLSIILRRTRLDWGRSSFQAKGIGTLISIIGVVVVELYKGPYIRESSSSIFKASHAKDLPQPFVFYSTSDHWILGGMLLAAASLSISIWNIIQLETVRQYPHVMKLVSFYSLAGTIQCGIFCFFMERELNAWKLKLNVELLLIIATGIFASVIRSSVHVSFSRTKGPFYVSMFKPFGIFFATLFGVCFFTNSLHYGSVIGTLVTGIGYYALMWGQISEDEVAKDKENLNVDDNVDSLDMKTPLLQEESEV